MTFHRDDPSLSDTFRMPSITSAAAGKWSSQWSGGACKLTVYYWIIIILRERREQIMQAVVYIAVCSLWKHG